MRNKKQKHSITFFLSASLLAGFLLCLIPVFSGIAAAKQQRYASAGKAFEVNSAASADGTAYLAFEDRSHRKRVRVRKLAGNNWQDLAGISSAKGLISAGQGSNPVLETKDQEVYAAFSDNEDLKKVRVKHWNGADWQDLADANHQEGKISDLGGLEPAISFDKSESNLYIAFWDEANGTKIRVMRWNGSSWENCADAGHPSGLVSESTAAEVDIAASKTDDSMYIAYQDIAAGNRVRVKKWNGSLWSDVSDASHPNGYISSGEGFNPAIAVDSQDHIYVAYPNPREGYIGVQEWNGSGWTSLDAPSSRKAAEISLAIDGSDNPWIAFSEKYKKNRWALKLKKFSDGMWREVPKASSSSAIAKGKNMMDPSLSYAQGKIFLAFTEPAKKRRARVAIFDSAAY